MKQSKTALQGRVEDWIQHLKFFNFCSILQMVGYLVGLFPVPPSHLPRPSLGKAEAIIIVANPKLLRLICHFVLPM